MAQLKQIRFKTVQLFKDQTLGIGSYGKVCRAKCDDLLCAAKLIHETLFDPTAQQLVPPQREHRLPMRRFEQECEFLSTIRHPNIVQYLGIYQDHDTSLPALLMELMDDSLTHFLESSPQPIPYHIQVNICHDITLALSFLHSNDIVHRDLSSNNVLLIGNVRAKVTDFGMARLGDNNPLATQLTFTICPGTDVYMPPETVKDMPVYTEKIDCFSFGVITIQIVTRQFPKPGDRRKEIHINQPGLPLIVEVPVSEIERRQSHIDEIDLNHPLKQVALDCLKDRDVERPSAQQLCERVAALKEDPQYSESVRAVEARSKSSAEQNMQGKSEERDRELRSLRQQVQSLQRVIQSQRNCIAEKDQIIARKDQIIVRNNQRITRILIERDEAVAELRQPLSATQQSEREKSRIFEAKERELRPFEKVGEIDQLERQLEHANQQLDESERANRQYQRHIFAKAEQMRPATDTYISSSSKEQRASIELTWREGEKAPCEMSIPYCAAVDGSILYVRLTTTHQMFSYTINTSSWSRLPNSPSADCPSVIINNLLTLVGGRFSDTLTNQLFSLTGEGSGRRWNNEFPPMPTKQHGSTALCTGAALIVAGGLDKDWSRLRAVEVLNTETLQWSTAADLPQPLSCAPAAVCGDQIYILRRPYMYTCSIATLIQSCKSFLASIRNRGARVWKEVAGPPVTGSTCVSIHGRLLAIGGEDSDEKPITAVHMYNPTTDSWNVISHMARARYACIAAAFPNNQLMVVGGCINAFVKTDSVEFATIA